MDIIRHVREMPRITYTSNTCLFYAVLVSAWCSGRKDLANVLCNNDLENPDKHFIEWVAKNVAKVKNTKGYTVDHLRDYLSWLVANKKTWKK